MLHSCGWECQIMLFACERRFILCGIGHGAAESSWINSGNHVWILQSGATRRRAHSVSLVERSEGKHINGCWTSHRPEHPAVLRNWLVSDSCLRRHRGRPLPCGKLTKLSEPSWDVVSIALELHCPWTTYLLPGSVCPEHEPPIKRWVCFVPKTGDVESSCTGDATWGHLGDWYKLPPLCCPSGPGHGTPLRLAGRFWGPDKPPSSRGSWHVGVARESTRSWMLNCPCTESPNLSWWHLSWLPSFWRTDPTERLIER